MKQNKRIMEQLVEYSRPPSSQNKNMQQLDSQRQQSQENSINLETNPNIESNETKFSVELQPAFNFEVCIEIGDGRTQTLFINQNSDPLREAQKICKKYMLEDYIVELLTDSLKQQIKKEKNLYKSMIESQALSKEKSVMGAQKIFNQSRTYRYNKHSQELWKDNEEEPYKGPVINEVSSEIVRKMGGKDKIIQSMARKFHEKQQQHILQQIQNQQREYEGYPFHPSIDPISRKVDETLHFSRNQKASLARYEHLYQQHKLIENKKQLSRRNSLMQIPFRPLINNVSRVIMQKKRSLGEFYPLSAGKQRPKSTHKYKQAEERVQKNEKKLRSKRQSLNSSSWQLCHHLYQEAKKRQQKIQKQTQKVYSNLNNWKIIENSNNLVFQLRQNRIGEVFDSLVKPPYHELHCFNIDQAKLNNVEKIFLPIFRQMRQINASLNREQFIEAGLRLLKYLSPNQRAILIRKNTQTTTTTDKQNQTRVLPINKKSKQIVDQKGYGQKSIYMRGLVYRSEIKNQIEKGREEKVRNELKSCTFKPKINSIPQNIGY